GQSRAEEGTAPGPPRDGCPECGTEAEPLRPVPRLMPPAAPARIAAPPPQPPASLGERIEATIGAERATARHKRRRRRFSFGFAGATVAAAAAVLAIVAFTGGGGQEAPEPHVAFHDGPKGIEHAAPPQPPPCGT